jgi:hypothetical protein
MRKYFITIYAYITVQVLEFLEVHPATGRSPARRSLRQLQAGSLEQGASHHQRKTTKRTSPRTARRPSRSAHWLEKYTRSWLDPEGRVRREKKQRKRYAY